MNFNFLDKFERRMKTVGLYSVLFRNSYQKTTWKNFGFERLDDQINVIFTVLLFIMEQSLKEEICTMDDITSYLDEVNMKYFQKGLTFQDCRELSDFIVNVILCNEGKAMYFKGYNFKEQEYEDLHISFIQNRVVYLEGEIRRTSYSLTNDGYTMLLATLELEGNMKLTIHEMIFKLHLEKATYDKAVEEVKNIFNQLRIRLQNMQEAMARIKRNALEYSVKEYRQLLEDNMNSLDQTSVKYEAYRQIVLQRVNELEEKDINLEKLEEKDLENLAYLKTIEKYLSRAIDELQKLMITHFDYKNLYTSELEAISQMSMVKRFSLRTEVYDKILDDVNLLTSMDEFLRPVLQAPLKKTYNLNKAFQLQKLVMKEEETEEELVDFDEEAWEEERRERIRLKLLKYKNSVSSIIKMAHEKNGISLREMKMLCDENPELKEQMIPSAEIFREVVIELLKSKSIDVKALRKEQSENVVELPTEFQLNISLLEVMKDEEELSDLSSVSARKIEGDEPVCFEHIKSADHTTKRIVCSNVYFDVT